MPVHVGDNDVRAVFAKVDDVESLSRWHKKTAGETTTDGCQDLWVHHRPVQLCLIGVVLGLMEEKVDFMSTKKVVKCSRASPKISVPCRHNSTRKPQT